MYSYLESFFNFLWNFIKSLDPDATSFQEFYTLKSIRDMQRQNENYSKSLSMLKRRLPIEISELVLIYANMNPYVFSSSDRELRGMECDLSYLSLFVTPLNNAIAFDESRSNAKQIENCRLISCIEFTCNSHDQGFSDFPNDHGTTQNSWTYGELLVECQDQEDIRYRIYTNVHANSQYQLQQLHLDFEHPFVNKINHLLRQNKQVRLSFRVRAIFPGWIHFIKNAELKAFYLNRS